jgi:hypothetical protein
LRLVQQRIDPRVGRHNELRRIAVFGGALRQHDLIADQTLERRQRRVARTLRALMLHDPRDRRNRLNSVGGSLASKLMGPRPISRQSMSSTCLSPLRSRAPPTTPP